ncbi:hypothetical protein ABZ714_00410 [Streptomyces sp. NPDC006798]|uniref:hypothetical protein n=1 Tax=Streptomyces sp. NPDC006798 TaxID=3155462 RepID=UPI0033CC2432
MNEHTGRATMEKEELYAVAAEVDELREEITVPSSPAELPGLVTASRRLTELTGLVTTLADEVQSRADDDTAGLDLGPVIHAYTAASVHAGQALANYTEAYHQLGTLRRHALAPDSGDLSDTREAAFRMAQWRLELTRDGLGAVSRSLRESSDRIDSTPPRILAALSRSARPANSIYRPPAFDLAKAPVSRLAYTPEPRRGR